ncbi:K(+)-insensitive pyrophosphate-energized proton pump [Actinoplanes lobatus]|uniref:K(+)-insensitive pyrophosphate-energized proton pump n=1 Tax=Actinoplanes lobatus TaxID=113568 RepID=A0A7W7MFD6_9ACTN|nr:sodium-translocating pyrophosphatase [Actinoplanes lobatus]MBB4748204.1 K(+)-stimulated pyrophosphate-energized sodium pump [Actinoplanes lobatus]GGN70172.1 K(+)-insensitive pyrophosphate-energized proton pump [Actinoplanes lobatus]GIE40053.1 K(+)-insensitive pyrophosphate-energized proton pump [Actinoplanes lobatus]
MSGTSIDLAADGGGVSLSGSNVTFVIVALVFALVALGFAAAFVQSVLKAERGTPKMQEIAGAVQEGASAYLFRQFKTLGIFVVIAVVLLFLLPVHETDNETWVKIGRSLFFIVGAVFSSFIGGAGMALATRANLRVAAAAGEQGGREKAMGIAFRTGGVVGFLTVGLGLFGGALVVLIFRGDAPTVLEGFGFGAALLAMFMRVGGGIFTKAADVGADLVGKVEQGIPEDDPRNAATIADNVGDNVGDCAGMAADLFESYAVTLVAALILGSAAFGQDGLIFPLIVSTIGVLIAIVGVFITRLRASDRNGLTAINRAFYISAAISAVAVAVVSFVYLPDTFAGFGDAGIAEDILNSGQNPQLVAVGAVVIGIVLAAAIQALTGYFTETDKRPVQDIGRSSQTGAATVVLAGISVGLESAVYSALLLGAGVFGAYLLGGSSLTLSLFAVALAGTGLLTTVGVIVAMDTFGPISDNAQGIAEMSGDVDERGAQILTELDAVGNTTKAITKGIAIATAVLAATALFGSYTNSLASSMASAGVTDVGAEILAQLNISNPRALVGLLIGSAVVFLFSGLAINAVSRSAGAVVMEVRRQFREFPGIMDGTQRPEYGRVVDICTRDAQRELLTPGLLAITAPIAVGFGLGPGALAAYLAGAIGTGTLMAVFLSNSGGAWDNAKKLVEDGAFGGKGSEAHAATVIGDTVGDPFKDTAGPAINPLLKVMNLVSLLIAPAVVTWSYGADANTALRVGVAVVAVAIVATAVFWSKRKPVTMGDEPSAAAAAAAVGAADTAKAVQDAHTTESSRVKDNVS